MVNYNTRKESICPVCKSLNIKTFLEIPDVPVHCNLLWETGDDALCAPRSDIVLMFCEDCEHIFNSNFDPNLMEYTQQYENSLHFSPYFQGYAKELADRLIGTYNLHGKSIIEIGCGKGDFLKLLCETGGNRGVGFDSSYENVEEANSSDSEITFIKDFYSMRYLNYESDFICCRQVLEHIQYPYDFMTDLRKMIGSNDTIVFFEVPNVDYTLNHPGIWDLIYEHRSFFSKSSLAFLLKACGFSIYDLTETYNGQFLCIEAVPDNLPPDPNTECLDTVKMGYNVKKFAETFRATIETWQKKMKIMEQSGKKAILWGAGSKGVTFLNMVGKENQIKYVIDINPRKQGKYIPGTGQKILSPEFLREYRPDIAIVMNPIYKNEIQQTLDRSRLLTQLMFV
ncbi:MAG TPA: class I SAM-dependent methyltransferase [Candidatus Methylomirabilis sp.]|nr:class I SAM-dependent methyltransferase [Candidatus Methylomirabilis sp.]